MFNIEKVIVVLKKYDKMFNNPDIINIEKNITNELQKVGFLRLCVFVCPKFNPRALFSSSPENYMPIEVNRSGLFEPRVAKILSLKKDLMKVGLPTEINLIIGDNDAEEYIFPFIKSFSFNKSLYKERQLQYKRAFEEMYEDLFGGKERCFIWSFADLDVFSDKINPEISEEALKKEIKFFERLFSSEGPYEDTLKFSKEELIEMVSLKYKLYGAQGKFLEELGGILLQTEGPGVWLERTEMLKCTGAFSIPVIYPWIRAEER
ncbi:MAG: hypothetical protein Athens071416_579 [Parcubacteria group bacterium Athens0714_16]|nr:MAG: hypothetical protein Athens071416_579 [Parcubacteria group bacterium Athens0714_16]